MLFRSVNAVYKSSSNGAFARDYALPCGIYDSGLIPRGRWFSRHSNKEFVQFLFISKGSAAEVQSQLHRALDQDYISQGQFDRIYGQIEVVARQISRFITYLKGAG